MIPMGERDDADRGGDCSHERNVLVCPSAARHRIAYPGTRVSAPDLGRTGGYCPTGGSVRETSGYCCSTTRCGTA
jgi:hypothetical protein